MIGQLSTTEKARSQRRELLIDLCYDFAQQNAIGLDVITLTQRKQTSWISHFIGGIASIQIFPMTKPGDVFKTAGYSMAEALQRDWAVVGQDLCVAITKQLRDEVKWLAQDQSHVESSGPTTAEIQSR